MWDLIICKTPLKNHIGKLLWVRAVACDGAECQLAWTDSPDNELIRDIGEKTGIWEGICSGSPEKGGAAREGLVRGQDPERGTPPLGPKAEQRSRGGDQIDMVNWIDEGNLPAKIRPENQKRETRQGKNKAKALGNEGTKSHEESALLWGEACLTDGCTEPHWSAVVHLGLKGFALQGMRHSGRWLSSFSLKVHYCNSLPSL